MSLKRQEITKLDDSRAPFCQSCTKPIEIDEKFYDIDQIEKKIINDAVNSGLDNASDNKLPSLPLDTLSSIKDDFCEASTSLSNRFIINSYLFDLLSDKTPFEHPLCQNCSDAILSAVDKQVMFKNDELKCINDYYQGLLKKSCENRNSSEEEDDKWSDDFDEDSSIGSTQEAASENFKTEDAENILKFMNCSIEELAQECKSLDEKLIEEEADLKKKEEELERITREYNDSKLALLNSESEIFTLELRLQSLSLHYNRLKHSNILNMTFPISNDQHIGTISGLHLGRLPNKPIEWCEINAAWGQCALLMTFLARKLECNFTNYTVVYHADQSRMHRKDTDRDYLLANNSGSMRIFSGGNFDMAMMAFLECLAELQNKVSKEMTMPYQVVNKHLLKHVDETAYSIKYSRKTEENWTKALQRMLANLKWLIVVCSAIDKKQ